MYGCVATEECFIKNEIIQYFFTAAPDNLYRSCTVEFGIVKQLLDDFLEDRETNDETVPDDYKCKWLPFGSDSFGNYFSLQLTGVGSGSVKLLLPEFSHDSTPFKFLANSFEAFIEALELNPNIVV